MWSRLLGRGKSKPQAAPGVGGQDSAAGTALDEQIAAWMARKNVPGVAACIVKEDKVAWSGGWGMANIAKRVPFTPDTLFQIASVSKVITAAAVLQLRDKGLFRLDDDVGRFLKFPVRNPKYPARPITFRHLLTHTSSLDDDEDDLNATYAVGDPVSSIEEAVTRYFKGADIWGKTAPGAEECYSNAGFALLGHLVEVLSEQTLEDYLQKNVYGILGMTETSFYISKLDQDRHARPYTFAKTVKAELCPGDGDGNLLPRGVSPKAGYNEHALYSYPTLADGMVRTSVNQLANFAIAMMNEGRFGQSRLLQADTVKEMLPDRGPGLAWFRSGPYWGHDGGDPGCSTELLFDPRAKVGVIVFANTDVELGLVKGLLRTKGEARDMIA
jgi:CubicO group peptidase (beta-lactamase class C family)